MKVTLQEVKAWLDACTPHRRFDMNTFCEPEEAKNWCGTTCCIGGYVYTLVTPIGQQVGYSKHEEMEAIAAKALGLRPSVAHELFYPPLDIEDENGDPIYYHAITAEQASQAVQIVIDHGEPRWREILAL